MPEVLSAIDIAMVPLKKLDLFKGAIPSKIFEALAMEKPLLLGVEGEAKHHFIDRAQAGLFYIPEDIENLKEQIIYFRNNREEVKIMGKEEENMSQIFLIAIKLQRTYTINFKICNFKK